MTTKLQKGGTLNWKPKVFLHDVCAKLILVFEIGLLFDDAFVPISSVIFVEKHSIIHIGPVILMLQHSEPNRISKGKLTLGFVAKDRFHF